MCLAIFKPAGTQIPYEYLEAASLWNPHGMGFAYAHNGQLIVKKGYFDFDQFMQAFEEVQANFPTMVHFRAASKGVINAENCHPFNINEKYAMIHNGTIQGFGDDEISDTADFTNYILTPLFNKFGDTPVDLTDYSMKYLLITGMRGNSKIVVLAADGRYCIYGEGRGKWIDGVWYSNEYSLTIPLPTTNVVEFLHGPPAAIDPNASPTEQILGGPSLLAMHGQK